MSWTRDEAKALAGRILGMSTAPECEVALELSRTAHTRFAASDPTTAGAATDLVIVITSRGAGRSGTVRVNDTETEALRAAVRRSEELMSVSPVDPEFVEGLTPQTYPETPSWFDETDTGGPTQRAAAVKLALDAARGRSLTASGYLENGSRWSAIANKKGNFGFQRATAASFSTTMRTPDGSGSGWAGFESPRLSALPVADLVAHAARKAETSVKPRDLEPGRYTVVLEAEAVGNFLGSLAFSLSARTADEGRSYFSKPGGGNRVGEKLFADSVTISSDPFDSRNPARPWAGGGGFGGFGGGGGGGGVAGLPVRRTTWIEKGVLKALTVDRYWAGKTGQAPLPLSSGLVMQGGTGTADDLLAGVERGLLVTRFWYIRSVNPQTLQVTGLTRDGVWLIEKGKIVAPVNNFRFNESPAVFLKNVEAMGASVAAGNAIVPPVRARDFNFSSRSDAV